jgi:hypothetical protein
MAGVYPQYRRTVLQLQCLWRTRTTYNVITRAFFWPRTCLLRLTNIQNEALRAPLARRIFATLFTLYLIAFCLARLIINRENMRKTRVRGDTCEPIKTIKSVSQIQTDRHTE